MQTQAQPQDKEIQAETEIEVRDLEIRYGAVAAVGPVSFSVPKGKQLTLLGPSGCGKSTTLRAIAGLEKPAAGVIKIGDRNMYSSAENLNIPAEDRGLSMVFQSYAIWPHMTVYDNVAYGLKVRRKNREEIDAGVKRALALVQMEAYASRPASQLSGGQQQRVALARACAFSPEVLLFDEPLSNLDAKLRGDMRIELRELQHSLGVTSIYVTHDLEEALAMSDCIVVMNKGRIEQSGTPYEIYNYPRTAFVADFVGSSNLISGTVREDLSSGNDVVIETQGGELIHGNTHGRKRGSQATLSVRTVHLQLSSQRPAGDRNVWQVTIARSVFLGDLSEIHVEWGGRKLIIRRSALDRMEEGQQVFLSVDPNRCVLLEDDAPAA
ncbi:ABC transporter ATP-binding protein [Candidimonas humi]|uniref:ABC transporter ATP-binding protein n=1 Tax=Candidimonas humi TaxID=683355 RepID=A0ABV8NZN1_9BURK|nr:ABC transporter ATP-binding protein [Candidimonas humi]MBV6306323.1 ABC transporter ATP-binding protein [Candidimonas humi]